MPGQVATEEERADAEKRVAEAEVLFAARFEAALIANKGNPPAACAQIFAEAGDDPELCTAIILLHLTYFMRGLGRAVGAGSEKPGAIN